MSTVFKCSPRETKNFIKKCISKNLVPFVRSMPGCGKSSIVRQIAEELDMKLIDIRLAGCEASDIQGLPWFKDNRAYYAPFNIFPVVGDGKAIKHYIGTDTDGSKVQISIEKYSSLSESSKKHCKPVYYTGGVLVFLDEFNSASRSVLAACYKLILDRYVGNYALHPDVRIVCAGNRDEDGAITNNIGTALQSRVIHFEMELNFQDWLKDIAIKHNYDERIVGYLSMYNNRLSTFEERTEGSNTYASPRTWEFANTLIKGDVVDSSSIKLLAGTLGDDVASEFVQFADLYTNLISIDEIINNPESCEVPQAQHLKWATISMLWNKINSKNKDAIYAYVNRFDTEFKILFLRYVSANKGMLLSGDKYNELFTSISVYLFED